MIKLDKNNIDDRKIIINNLKKEIEQRAYLKERQKSRDDYYKKQTKLKKQDDDDLDNLYDFAQENDYKITRKVRENIMKFLNKIKYANNWTLEKMKDGSYYWKKPFSIEVENASITNLRQMLKFAKENGYSKNDYLSADVGKFLHKKENELNQRLRQNGDGSYRWGEELNEDTIQAILNNTPMEQGYDILGKVSSKFGVDLPSKDKIKDVYGIINNVGDAVGMGKPDFKADRKKQKEMKEKTDFTTQEMRENRKKSILHNSKTAEKMANYKHTINDDDLDKQAYKELGIRENEKTGYYKERAEEKLKLQNKKVRINDENELRYEFSKKYGYLGTKAKSWDWINKYARDNESYIEYKDIGHGIKEYILTPNKKNENQLDAIIDNTPLKYWDTGADVIEKTTGINLPKTAQIRDTIDKIDKGADIIGMGILDFFKPIKQDYNNVSNKTIKKYGEEIIIEMTVIRVPIMNVVNKLFNVLTFGQWEEELKNSPYDKMMHLGLKIDFKNKNGVINSIIVEKNETVNVSSNIGNYKNEAESMNVKLPNKEITLNEFLKNCLFKIGHEKMFLYNGKNQNCQVFILDLLSSSNLLTQKLKQFIYQDVTTIFKNLPKYAEKIMNLATDTGAKFNQAIGGKKQKQKQKPKQKIQTKYIKQVPDLKNHLEIINKIKTKK